MKRLALLVCAVCLAILLPICALADRIYFLNSDTQVITEEELWKWDRESLSFMFNEIFARHGFTFEPGGKFYNWFNSQPWYQSIPKVSDQTAYQNTTKLEWDNYHTIKKVIREMEASGHPYRKGANSTLLSWTDFQPPGQWSLTGFQLIQLKTGQNLPVYSAPSASSWRGGNGKASVSTSGAVWAAGMENGWLQIFYEITKGGLRVGYVNAASLNEKLTGIGGLYFSYIPCQVTAACRLTDDPLQQVNTITSLRAGDQVTYLTTAINQRGQAWDYVETTVNGQTARGYVPSGSLDLPEDSLPDLESWSK